LDFDGTDDRLNMTYGVNDNTSTWFWVAQYDTGSTTVSGTQGNNGYQLIHNTDTIQVIDRFQGGADATLAGMYWRVSAPVVVGVRLDFANTTIFARSLDNISTATLASGPSSNGNLAIMFSHINGQIVQDGAVAELIKYAYPMTDDEFTLTFRHLA
jgi:hypothetical protein